LRAIVSIFKNDYKPPKNLWIDKGGADSNKTGDTPKDRVDGVAGDEMGN